MPLAPLYELIFGALLCGAFTILYLKSGALTLEQRDTIGDLFGGSERKILRLLGIAT